MTTLLIVLLAAIALALCSVRDDSPKAKTPRQAAADLRSAGLRRVTWLALQAVAGVALVLLLAALRTGMYHALLAIAGGASWLAAAVALDRVDVHRLELRA